MKKCKFCCEDVEDGARKCKTCGEPFYVVGKVLKFTPLASIFITVFPFAFAFIEIIENTEGHSSSRLSGKCPYSCLERT